MKNSTTAKIRSFKTFQEGWSFGEGVKFSDNILNKAVKINETALKSGFQETDAFPGLNGEIMVALYLEQDYWEFTLEPDESLTFVYEQGEETIIYEEGRSFEFAIAKIKNIGDENHLTNPREKRKPVGSLWLLSELSTRFIMTNESQDSKVLLSKILPREEYRFLTKNAFWNWDTVYVTTLENFTHHPLAVNRQYSGNLKKTSYRVVTS